MGKVTLSPEERRERLEAAGEEIAQAVERIVSGDDWQRALEFASQLHHYSARNLFWLLVQLEDRGVDASHFAGYRTWQAMGRQVRKGESSFKVLAPCRYTREDEETGERVSVLRGFRIESVFADSQTDGETEIPRRPMPTLLTGDGPEGLWDALAKLVAEQGFSLSVVPFTDSANGRTDYGARAITVRDDLDPAAQAKTLAHELGHAMLHGSRLSEHRGQIECEAESVAFLVLDAFGLATGEYTFPYVASWSQGKTDVVTAALDNAKRCAAEIMAAISETEEVAA